MADHMVITLFRHSLTNENKRKAYSGWTDSSVCPDELRKLEPIKEVPDLVYTSDLRRCIQTSKHLFVNHPRILEYPELRELHFGEWEGKTYQDLKQDPLYQNWINDPISNNPSGGEAFGEFEKRVMRGWKVITTHMVEHHTKHVAIVAHGGVIRYILSKYAPVEKPFWNWSTPHTSAYQLHFSEENLRRNERCILLQEVPLMAKAHG